MSALPFGVVVIARDEEAHLAACLDSLRDAGTTPLVVVVDTRTRDATAAMARAYTDHVLIVDGERGRLRNAGYRYIDRPLVAYLDADMRATPGYFKRLAEVLTGSPRIAAVAGRQFAQESCLFSKLECQYWNYRRAVGAGGAMFRAAALEDIGGFRNELNVGEDADALQRLRARGWRIAWIPTVGVQHEHARDLREWHHKMTHGSGAGLHWRSLGRAAISPAMGVQAALKTRCLHLLWYVPMRALVMLRRGGESYRPWRPGRPSP